MTRKTKILISPADYVLDRQSVSEFYFSSELINRLANKNSGILYYVLCGYCADKNNFPNNVKIFELFKTNNLTLHLFTRIYFYVWILYKSIILSLNNRFFAIWHLFPRGQYSFNFFIISNLHKFFGIKKTVALKLYSFYDADDNIVSYKNGEVYSKKKNTLVYNIFYYLLGFFSKIYYKKFDQLFFCSHFAKKNIERSLDINFINNYTIIPDGIDYEKFKFKQKKLDNMINFLYLGNLIKRKQVDKTLILCSKMKQLGCNFILDIVGDGHEMNNLISLAEKLNIFNNIKFHGFIAKENINTFFEKANFLFLFSKEEALGHVLLEAMATGTLFIGSQIETFEEIITHEVNGYLFNIEKINYYEKYANIIINTTQKNYDIMTRKAYNDSKKYRWENIVNTYYNTLFKQNK